MNPIRTLFFLALIAILGCSDDDDFCPSDSTDVGHGTCIVFSNFDDLEMYMPVITSVTRTTIDEINTLMPTEGIRITMQSSPENAIPEVGVGGFNPNEKEVIISFHPGYPDIDLIIAQELPIQLAHEIHHARRRRAVGYGNSLLQAAVTEGLADCFAEEVTGNGPSPWSIALTDEEIDDWIAMIKPTWNQPGYDHSRWFLGTAQDVPRWAGYAIGYKLVKDYIAENPGAKASELFGEPATAFVQ